MAATTITIRLRKQLMAIHTSRHHDMAIKYLKQHIARHGKTSYDSIRVSQKLNEYLEANSTNRYKPIKLSFNKGAEIVDVALQEELTAKPTDNNAKATAKPADAKTAGQQKATDKVVGDITKQVASDISKKAEEKKAAAKATPAKKEEPKKENAQKPKSEATPSEQQK